MAKLISLMVRLTVIAGVLVSLQSVAARRLAQARKAADRAGAAASDNKGNPLPNENSGALGLAGGGLGLPGFDLASTFLKLMPLPAGQTGASKPAAPPQPSTLIRYVGPDGKGGDSADTAVMELPPGAKAIVIDGRLQIYRPSGPPKEPQAAKREIAGGRKRDREKDGTRSTLRERNWTSPRFSAKVRDVPQNATVRHKKGKGDRSRGDAVGEASTWSVSGVPPAVSQ